MLYYSFDNGFQIEPSNNSILFNVYNQSFTVLSIYNYDKPIQIKLVNNSINFKKIYKSYFNSFDHTTIDYQIENSTFDIDNYHVKKIIVHAPSHPYLNVYTLYVFQYIYPLESIKYD